MSKIFASTVDGIIDQTVPQRESGGVGHFDEVTLSAMFSVFDITMNIVTFFYSYFTLTHPIIVLLCYLLAYILLLLYIYNLGDMLKKMNMIAVPPDDNNISQPKNKVRTNTQTHKSTPPRFQKGKYKHLKQRTRRGIIPIRRQHAQ